MMNGKLLRLRSEDFLQIHIGRNVGKQFIAASWHERMVMTSSKPRGMAENRNMIRRLH
jgi:hypothetical protein